MIESDIDPVRAARERNIAAANLAKQSSLRIFEAIRDQSRHPLVEAKPAIDESPDGSESQLTAAQQKSLLAALRGQRAVDRQREAANADRERRALGLQ
jgi:hypothetical protein